MVLTEIKVTDKPCSKPTEGKVAQIKLMNFFNLAWTKFSMPLQRLRFLATLLPPDAFSRPR